MIGELSGWVPGQVAGCFDVGVCLGKQGTDESPPLLLVPTMTEGLVKIVGSEGGCCVLHVCFLGDRSAVNEVSKPTARPQRKEPAQLCRLGRALSGGHDQACTPGGSSGSRGHRKRQAGFWVAFRSGRASGCPWHLPALSGACDAAASIRTGARDATRPETPTQAKSSRDSSRSLGHHRAENHSLR